MKNIAFSTLYLPPYLLIRLSGQCPKQKRCKRSRLHRAKRNIVAVENSHCKDTEFLIITYCISKQSYKSHIFAPRKTHGRRAGSPPRPRLGSLGDLDRCPSDFEGDFNLHFDLVCLRTVRFSFS